MAVTWVELVRDFGLTDSTKGPRSIFGPQDKLALMLLNHYAASSDMSLVEQLNGNINYHFFVASA
ncbi:hypothetical protein [Maribacter polysiphoniae]|uniref:hypothetical protein n=1 Tax=Maribacter polysiphoniae TaxID=429344 RepID=UPI00235427BD|nr:hypothetical protein [Maribacter polysiphoniae]